MKTFALALTAGAVSAVSAISNVEIKYMQYLSQWGKQYDTVEEFMTRLEHFVLAEQEINEINARWDQALGDVQTVEIPLEKTDIRVADVKLVWVPVG